MSNDILGQIECLREKNHHDSTSEIHAACRYWVMSGAGEAWSKRLAVSRAKNECLDIGDFSRFAKMEWSKKIGKTKIATNDFVDLESAISTLADDHDMLESSIISLQNDVAALTALFEQEHNLLLKIIEKNEQTIGRLLRKAETTATISASVNQAEIEYSEK